MNADSNSRPIVRERGSAYLVTLLILVVLTLMGLSLALITGTESQIGFNERVMERTFYAGDAGIGVAAARVLVASDYLYDANDDDNIDVSDAVTSLQRLFSGAGPAPPPSSECGSDPNLGPLNCDNFDACL